MDPIALQQGVCDPSVAGQDYLTQFEFIKAFTCTYASAAGFLVTGLLVYGAISLSIYIRTGSVAIPAILVLLTGGVVVVQLAAPAVAVATILVLVAGAGVLTYLYYSYS